MDPLKYLFQLFPLEVHYNISFFQCVWLFALRPFFYSLSSPLFPSKLRVSDLVFSFYYSKLNRDHDIEIFDLFCEDFVNVCRVYNKFSSCRSKECRDVELVSIDTARIDL
jgi:hypothetical protein